MLTRRHWLVVLCVAALLVAVLGPLAGQAPLVAALVLLPPIFGLAPAGRVVARAAVPLPTFVASAPLPFRGPPTL
jgi:hypothetical protein